MDLEKTTGKPRIDLGDAVGTFMRRGGVKSTIVRALAFVGAGLFVLNFLGFVIPLRQPSLTEDFGDFSRPTTLSYEDAVAQLEALNKADTGTYVAEVNRIFGHAMAHVTLEELERGGPDFYRTRVPPWENYLLYGLSFLRPDTYASYEFCSYEKALERGIGWCGDQATAVVDFLSDQNFKTGFVNLLDERHVVATVEVDDGEWYILDPDYGVTIPLGVEEVSPQAVAPYYARYAGTRNEGVAEVYSRPSVRYGGTEARWARKCPIEKVLYGMKWLLPALLLLPWAACSKSPG